MFLSLYLLFPPLTHSVTANLIPLPSLDYCHFIGSLETGLCVLRLCCSSEFLPRSAFAFPYNFQRQLVHVYEQVAGIGILLNL